MDQANSNAVVIVDDELQDDRVRDEKATVHQSSVKVSAFTSLLLRQSSQNEDIDQFVHEYETGESVTPLAEITDNETLLPYLTFAVHLDHRYAIKKLLKAKIHPRIILHALKSAVRNLNTFSVEMLLDYSGYLKT